MGWGDDDDSVPVYRLDAEEVGQEAEYSMEDGRLEQRMQQIVEMMCSRPAASLPQLFLREADLESVLLIPGQRQAESGTDSAGSCGAYCGAPPRASSPSA